MSERIIEELRKLNRTLERLLAYSTVSPDYWEVKLIDVDTPISIAPRGSKVVVDEQEVGRVFAIVASVNNKDAVVEVQIDDTIARNSIQGLYNAGMTSFNPSTFWLAKYDEANDSYVAAYTPVPWRDYHRRVKVTVYAPSNSAVSFTYLIYRYRFREQLLRGKHGSGW